MSVKTQLFSIKLTCTGLALPSLSFEWDACIHSSCKWEITLYWVTGQMKSRLLHKGEKPFSEEINELTCDSDPALLSLLLPESCQGIMQTKFQRVIRPPSPFIARMMPSTKTSASIFPPPSVENYSVSRDRAYPQCVETRLLHCAGDGKPLIHWEGNPWIQYFEVITLRQDSHHLTRYCLNIA